MGDASNTIFTFDTDIIEFVPKEASFPNIKLPTSSAVTVGEGNFGVVLRMEYNGELLAVKAPKHGTLESEIDVLSTLPKHENVINIIGISVSLPKMILRTFCENGSLESYLKINYDYEFKDIYTIFLGAATGLHHLISNGIVHRDVAKRNVLIDKNFTGKIGDFGLAKHFNENKEFVTHSLENLPLRILAPEVTGSRETFTFTEATDVWAFGILIFESSQYKDKLPNANAFDFATCDVLDIFEELDSRVVEIISQCWNNRTERPTFLELQQLFSAIINEKEEY